MSEVLARVEKERREERETYLGPYSLSVIPSLLNAYAPKGMEILALASESPVRIDERGMVHFSSPVSALVREKVEIHQSPAPKKVVSVVLRPEGVNGNFFVPLITERDSELYSQFRRYMSQLVADPNWRDRPLPGRELPRRLTESEESMWERWIRQEVERSRERDTYWREQGL